MNDKTELLKKARSFDEILEIKYGKRGTPEREDFHERARIFAIRELREEVVQEPEIFEEQFA